MNINIQLLGNGSTPSPSKSRDAAATAGGFDQALAQAKSPAGSNLQPGASDKVQRAQANTVPQNSTAQQGQGNPLPLSLQARELVQTAVEKVQHLAQGTATAASQADVPGLSAGPQAHTEQFLQITQGLGSSAQDGAGAPVVDLTTDAVSEAPLILVNADALSTVPRAGAPGQGAQHIPQRLEGDSLMQAEGQNQDQLLSPLNPKQASDENAALPLAAAGQVPTPVIAAGSMSRPRQEPLNHGQAGSAPYNLTSSEINNQIMQTSAAADALLTEAWQTKAAAASAQAALTAEANSAAARQLAGAGAEPASSTSFSSLLQNLPSHSAAPHAATALTGQTGLQLSAPLASAQWQQDLGQQMANMVRRGEQSVSLQLNPADLGPLMVELKVADQQAQMQFLSAHAQVRSAVEQALPQLREALAEQGITLGDTNVSEQRGEQQGSGDRGHGLAQTGLTGLEGEDAQASGAGAIAPEAVGANGRVNLYV